jgi:hypothetical protein
LALTGRATPVLLTVAANYKVDSAKLSPFMKKYLKVVIAVGELLQMNSKGDSTSFKLAATKSEKVTMSTIPVQGRCWWFFFFYGITVL